MVNPLNSFLSRYIHLKPYGEDIKQYFVQELKEIGINITTDDVQYQKGYVFINISPLAKIRLIKDKNKLIEAVNAKLGKPVIVDIR